MVLLVFQEPQVQMEQTVLQVLMLLLQVLQVEVKPQVLMVQTALQDKMALLV